MDDLVVVGTVVGVHGVKGELKVAPANGDPHRFRHVQWVMVQAGAAPAWKAAVEWQKANVSKGLAIVKLEEVADAGAAERLRGAELMVPASTLPQLPEGEYYHFMLVGLDCYDQEGNLLGQVIEVLDRPANDVLVVEAADGGPEYLVPMVKSYVVDIDLENRRVVVERRPGLR
ncbi:MAG: ribosome maturation factor RimM [Bacillota bacterium]|jgi:16S rRNA processing protein RimM|nr:16S rRNA processing protein RimM [Bacillota bacterium]